MLGHFLKDLLALYPTLSFPLSMIQNPKSINSQKGRACLLCVMEKSDWEYAPAQRPWNSILPLPAICSKYPMPVVSDILLTNLEQIRFYAGYVEKKSAGFILLANARIILCFMRHGLYRSIVSGNL